MKVHVPMLMVAVAASYLTALLLAAEKAQDLSGIYGITMFVLTAVNLVVCR